MHVPANWTLGRAAELRGEVEQALMSEMAGLRASIQLLPIEVEAQFHVGKHSAVIALIQRVAAAREVDEHVDGAIDCGCWCFSVPSPTTPW